MPKYAVTFVARNRDCEQFMGAEKVRYEVEAADRIRAQGTSLGRLSRRLRRKVWFHQDSGLLPGYGVLVTPYIGGGMSVEGLVRIVVEEMSA